MKGHIQYFDKDGAMKGLSVIFLSMVVIIGSIFLFGSCSQRHDEKTGLDTETSDFSGVWAVTDREGNKFDILLNKDGTATSTWSILEEGKWKVVSKKKAHIQWRNGMNEFIIVDVPGGAERQTFAPGKSTEGTPDEVTEIKRK